MVLYDQEPEGIVTVKFKEPEAALRCIELMDGRILMMIRTQGGCQFEAYSSDDGDTWREIGKPPLVGKEPALAALPVPRCSGW